MHWSQDSRQLVSASQDGKLIVSSFQLLSLTQHKDVWREVFDVLLLGG
jgi:hypothetical protein